ncbi:MAG: hypothetical protein GY847_35680 [Proteobacteria bacterium]|nr:hypothetical protein [Pseudomonadota bacterium]
MRPSNRYFFVKPTRVLVVLIGLWATVFPGPGSARADWQTPNMSDYTKTPPFISYAVKPNVIVALDMSGSMKKPAYGDIGRWRHVIHDDFDPAKHYYGYFDSAADYVYDETNEFFRVFTSGDSETDKWGGNFLNWLCMRRIDIVRRVLTGGKVTVKTTDKRPDSVTYNSAAPINRHQVRMESIFNGWETSWDAWYVLEGQNGPFDFGFTKQSDYSGSHTPAMLDGLSFLIEEGRIKPMITLGEHVEIGQVTLGYDTDAGDYNWRQVKFVNTYSAPRVVVKTSTFNNDAPMGDPIIKWDTPWPHTDATHFYVRLQEWDYLDGDHPDETLTYIVVDATDEIHEVTMDNGGGVWSFLADKDPQQVGSDECGCLSNPQTTRVSWDQTLPAKPIVFAGVSSWNENGDPDALVTRVELPGGEDDKVYVDVSIQEEKLNNGRILCSRENGGTQTIDYVHAIAVIPPSGASATTATATYNNKIVLQAGLKSAVTHEWAVLDYEAGFSKAPMFIGHMQTIHGCDPSNIRADNNNAGQIEIMVHEEASDGSVLIHSYGDTAGWLAVQPFTSYRIRIGVKTEPSAVLQDIDADMRIGLAAYNYDHTKDPDLIYVDNNTVHGGTMIPSFQDLSKSIGDRTNNDIVLSCGVHDPVENAYRVIEEHPLVSGTTPIAETLVEIMRYVQQDSSGPYGGAYYDNKTGATSAENRASFPLGDTGDPYYYPEFDTAEYQAEGVDPYLECARTFVLHFNDGAPFRDWDLEGEDIHPTALIGNDGVGPTGLNQMLDDVAYYIRNNDMRTDSELPGYQEIVSYYVYAALGESEAYNDKTQKMREAAVNGGFNDLDGDHIPDPLHYEDMNAFVQNCPEDQTPSEWDGDGNCEPDAFYYANDGYALENDLKAAFQSILDRTSSGTSVSVISGSRGGEGAIYQSIFYPKLKSGDYTVEWAGQVHALLIDENGNMREDSNGDKGLDSNDQFIVFEGEDVYLYDDDDGDNVLDDSEKSDGASGTFADIKFLWNSRDWLNHSLMEPTIQRTYGDPDQRRRYIFTFVDGDNDVEVDASEQMAFEAPSVPSWADVTDENKLYPYIHTHTPFTPPAGMTEADFKSMVRQQTKRIVDFIRGQDQLNTLVFPSGAMPAFRSRQIDLDGDGDMETWRLGDVVHSTPTLVARPAENYDLLYDDQTYTAFYKKYKNRRNVLYAGANDGMLHAFNAGFYDSQNKRYVTASDGKAAFDLGAELWAYVPYNLLPHLYWLTDPAYSHVYYCDLKPKVFDAKIFPVDAAHPGGWGTVLVAGMRFGGGQIAADMDKSDGAYDSAKDKLMSSAYCIFDITDPESPPTLLGEISIIPGLGFTTCYPAVIPVRGDKQADGSFGANQWYLMFGAGPAGPVIPPSPLGIADRTALDKASGTPTMAGRLFVVDLVKLATDHELWTIAAYSGTPTRGTVPFRYLAPHGFFSDPVSVDYDLDFNTDAVYLATVEHDEDLGWFSRLWRIVIDDPLDLSTWYSNTVISWGHTLGIHQPITTRPNIGLSWNKTENRPERWIFYGTGRYFVTTDTLNNDRQSYYAIKEPYDTAGGDWTWGTVNRSDLLDVSSAKVYKAEAPSKAEVDGVEGITGEANKFTDLLALMDTKKGWFLNFSEPKERNLGPATLLGDILAFTTYVPNMDPCECGGESYLYAAYYKTGTAYYKDVMGTVPDDDKTRVLRKEEDGQDGLSPSPSLHVGAYKGSKAITQRSTGGISSIDQDNPGLTRSKQSFWEDETNTDD